jgi:anti-sigma factor RsiW
VRLRRDDLHVLTGSYALDALPDAECEEFERHLRRCTSCDAEVRGLREAAARLAMAAAVQPPAELQLRVLSAAGRIRQLPPPDGDARRRVPRLRTGRPRHGRLGWPPRLAAAVAAAAVAAAASLGVAQVITQRQLASARASQAAIVAVLTAPDARIQAMRTSVGGTVTAVVSARQHAAVLTAAGLPPPPSDRVYQVWVMHGTGARSEGLFSRAGRNGPLLASGLRPGDRIGITVEPAGGTARPTTPPVVVMPLAA